MCRSEKDARVRRHATEVVELHQQLGFRGLLDAVPADRVLHRAVRSDGLATLALRTEDVPARYLLGLQGFRLAQYLQLGWACAQVVHDQALHCEPRSVLHDADVHVLSLDASTGRILGYVCLSASGDEQPRALDDERRARFPVEVAHGLDLSAAVPMPHGLRTDEVYELKRFVHDRRMSDREQRLRVTMELLLGAGRALVALDPPARVLVGDVEEDVALRHLLLAGLDVQLVDGTEPVLPETELMHLMYVARASVKPFVAQVPDFDELERRIALLEQALSSGDLFASTSALPSSMPGTTRRVAA